MVAPFLLMTLWMAGALPALGPPDVDGDGVDDVVDVCSNSPPGAIVDESGRPRADLDGDCDIDHHDFALFARDFTGMCLPEICDGLDNDCDAVPDDAAFSNDVEDCADGLDNDCDDLADCEDLSACPAATLCAVGNRICNAFGFCDCAPGFDDCNNNITDGCETDLMSDVNHCLACGRPCVFNHAIPVCDQGECGFDFCDNLWGNCNGFMEDGCERSLRNNNNCGDCDVNCLLAHASATCSTGICSIGTCSSRWGDCDEFPGNGCEYDLLGPDNDCAHANNAGSPICGDDLDNPQITHAAGSSWWYLNVQDCIDLSLTGETLGVTVELQSPPGMDYNLIVYRPCDIIQGFSTNGPGLLDTVVYDWPDAPRIDDSRPVWVEVRWVGGAGCDRWTLTIRSNGQ